MVPVKILWTSTANATLPITSMAVPPKAVISSTTARARSIAKSFTATLQPSLAKVSAISFPMP